VVDAADVSFCLSTQIQRLKLTRQTKSLPTATSELHALLGLPSLQSVPLLVLANKNDLPGAIGVDDLIKEMRLGEIGGRVVSVSLTL
jgi:signal recognition particle receptor subunit beta